MLNETGFGVGGDSSGRTIGDVVLVGRSWFRMTSGDEEGTPVPLSPTKTARIGIDRRRLGLERRMSDRRTSVAPIALPAPTEAQPVEWHADAEMPRRTITVSWWLVGVVGAVLMASGAAATAMMKVRSAPAPACRVRGACPARRARDLTGAATGARDHRAAGDAAVAAERGVRARGGARARSSARHRLRGPRVRRRLRWLRLAGRRCHRRNDRWRRPRPHSAPVEGVGRSVRGVRVRGSAVPGPTRSNCREDGRVARDAGQCRARQRRSRGLRAGAGAPGQHHAVEGQPAERTGEAIDRARPVSRDAPEGDADERGNEAGVVGRNGGRGVSRRQLDGGHVPAHRQLPPPQASAVPSRHAITRILTRDRVYPPVRLHRE